MKYGIDISYHQGNIDFDKVKASGKVDFVIIREGYGTHTDKNFFNYVNECKRVGIPILGIYHFAYSTDTKSSAAEADLIISNCKKAGLPATALIFHDFEYDSINTAKKKGITISKNMVNLIAEAFCARISALGYTAGIYTNIDYYDHYYTKATLTNKIVWLADYTGRPSRECYIQQTGSKGKINGISGNVDTNEIIKALPGVETENTVKDITVLVSEVIAGKWGSGVERKQKLTEAGYIYSEVQKAVNEYLNGAAAKTTSASNPQDQSVRKVVTATEAATKSDSKYSKTFRTTADLYMRNGAGTNKKAMCVVPKGSDVRCYGYYTQVGLIKWLYVQYVIDGVRYIGFCSNKYLV